MSIEPYKNSSLSSLERAKDLVGRMTLEEKAAQLLHGAKAVPHLDIPDYNWWNECLHGVARAGRATIFPQAIGMAAAFDTELMIRIGDAVSLEARAKYALAQKRGERGIYQGLTMWTPNINIFRDPRWGRGQETYGEDPYLTSEIGKSYVKGLQGDDPEHLKVAACAKHYAVHSGPEGLRHEFDATVSQKDLRETYLPAFKALVQEVNVESVMGAYNRTNGEVCCGSKTLLDDILRKEWQFDGHVVSDCWAVRDFHEFHKVTSRPEESVALALTNGCDVNCGCTYEFVIKACEEGLITEEIIDRSVTRLMRTRIKLGMFDSAEEIAKTEVSPSVVDCDEHRALAKEIASKSVVLLKNKNNILPINKTNVPRLYVTGANAASVDALIGNYYGSNPRIVTIAEGIAGKVDVATTIEYRLGITVASENKNPLNYGLLESANSDLTIAVLGIDNSIEGEEGDAISSDSKGDRDDITLPPHQVQYVKDLKAMGKPVVVIILAGCAVAIPEIHDIADAVIYGWYPGEEGGNAIGDILFGDAVPSGKLPVTVPKSIKQLPPYDDYSMKNRTYRYMEDEPLYPFGFGLSYSTFTIDQPKTTATSLEKGEVVTVSATVTNSGSYDCEQVLQAYVSLQGEELPKASLRSFKRIALKAGESKQVDFALEEKDFSYFNEKGEELFAQGEAKIFIGAASPGARSEELGAPKPAIVSITLA